MLMQVLWRGLVHEDTPVPALVPFEPLHHPLPPPTPLGRPGSTVRLGSLPDLREEDQQHRADDDNDETPAKPLDKRRKWQVPVQPADW